MNSDDGFDDQLFGRIDQIVTAAVEHGDTPGVVAGVALGDTVHVATMLGRAGTSPPGRRMGGVADR